MSSGIATKGTGRLASTLARCRVWKYRMLSTCPHVHGSPILRQPVLFVGEGLIVVGREVEFGWPTSILFYTGYCHVEASRAGSLVEFGEGVQVNNNAFIKSEGPGIRIGARALLGSHVEIFDSDFHDLRPNRRRDGRPKMGAVELGEDVFVGDGVKILKGVTIGAHSVIGAGSVVTRSIPAGVVAAGNPARVVSSLTDHPDRDPRELAGGRGPDRIDDQRPDRVDDQRPDRVELPRTIAGARDGDGVGVGAGVGAAAAAAAAAADAELPRAHTGSRARRGGGDGPEQDRLVSAR